MGLEIFFSIVFVVVGTMAVFSRQPFFSLYSLMGLVFSMAILYLIRGSLLTSTILMLSVGAVSLVFIVQLFMNLDLEKEFQRYYKLNVVPMFGMMVMGIILGVLALVLYGAKDLFEELYHKRQFFKQGETIFTSYGQMMIMAILGLLGVITTSALLIDNEEEEENNVTDS